MQFLKLHTWFLTVLFCFSSCKTNDASTSGKPADLQSSLPFTATWDPAALEPSKDFSSQIIAIGTVDYMDEASGLAVSRTNKGSLWGHNDSGNETLLYLIDKKNGKLKATYTIPGIQKGDFEDIATGPGPVNGKSYIYFADIGDNAQKRERVLVYRFEEPVFKEEHTGTVVKTGITAEHFSFTYPAGPKDAETILIDPATKDLYLVSKREPKNSIYLARYPFSATSDTQLTLAGTFPFTWSTAGDIAGDGSSVMIKTYDQVFYWDNEEKVPFLTLLSKKPQLAVYKTEPQGEAICIDDDGYYTLSERAPEKTPVLYFYPK